MTGNGAPSNPLYKASTPSSATSRLFADGLRNPWAMSQVPGNNPRVAIWDVGGDYREMLKVLGKNEFGGWPCREGTKSHNPGLCTAAQNASISKRLFDYTHTNGESCIIGGTFIPSSFRPSLRNRMLYSDYGSGRFWTGTISTAGYPVDRKDFGRLYGVIRVVRGPSGRLWAISFGQAGIWELWDSTPGAK